ncbi:unnamed protein product [Adineta ricciae]|uniref:Helicase C-terminal domain-containing protein n=1 Tax=Adineta ricciae TaxID=249248 RepID=A0A815YNE7_ADIRI|nr:unnamed protein product [Adineta ricciae]
MGYKDQIEDTSTMLPGNLQIIVTSSVILPDLLEITNKLMKDPAKILIEIEDHTLEGIRQFYVLVEDEHFNMDATQRDKSIREFCTGVSRILLRTDRSEDDTDIPQASPIINYDLSRNCEKYVHP